MNDDFVAIGDPARAFMAAIGTKLFKHGRGDQESAVKFFTNYISGHSIAHGVR